MEKECHPSSHKGDQDFQLQQGLGKCEDSKEVASQSQGLRSRAETASISAPGQGSMTFT